MKLIKIFPLYFCCAVAAAEVCHTLNSEAFTADSAINYGPTPGDPGLNYSGWSAPVTYFQAVECGAGSLDTLVSNSVVTLNSTHANTLMLNGLLFSNAAKVESGMIHGTLSASNSQFKDLYLVGLLKSSKSSFNNITASGHLILTNSTVNKNIVLTSDPVMKSNVNLIWLFQSSHVSGDIVFKGVPGVVYKSASATISGNVINGRIVNVPINLHNN